MPPVIEACILPALLLFIETPLQIAYKFTAFDAAIKQKIHAGSAKPELKPPILLSAKLP